ncbi:transcription factor MYB1R1-like [Curcuma longa]|uniref:transcription factor MYB1R1-like n=1 Tax=Curcuma longa TaxID=136217 RepID=UPI003D9F541E
MSSTEGKEMVGGGLKLFGVQLETPTSPMNKTLNFATDESSSSPFSACSLLKNETREKISKGNMSDGMAVKTQERKKGVPWSEEEHKLFLTGLEKLGKGNWRGISKKFVTTRTPTQVASHAQKHFLRQNSLNKTNRRSSLFDVVK